MATLVAAISHIEADVKLKGFEGDMPSGQRSGSICEPLLCRE
jgi:hypothetical protein